MERELRRLGETAQQDQDQRRDIQRIGLDQRAVLQDHRQIVTAHDLPEDQHPPDHRKATQAGHGKGHTRALPPFGQVFPVPDQQEGRQRCQLPENEQKQDVVGQNDPDHRPLKQQQVGEKLPHVVVAAEVVARIGDDQKADTKDQQRKEEPEPVQHQGKVQPQHRHPVDPRHHDLARQNGRQVGQQSDEGGQRDGKGHTRSGRAACGVHETGQQSTNEGECDDEE